jgi:hypothetical protein
VKRHFNVEIFQIGIILRLLVLRSDAALSLCLTPCAIDGVGLFFAFKQ